MTTPEDAEEVNGGNRLECNCGLVVVSDNPDMLLRIAEAHKCPSMYTQSEKSEDGGRWWHSLFSLEGVLMVFLIYLLLSSIFGHAK